MSSFKERMEQGIKRELAQRATDRKKYEESFDGTPPDPIQLSVQFGEVDGIGGIYKASPYGKVFSVGLTDHTAPSGVHYRMIELSCTEQESGGSWLDTVINGVSLLFEWNGPNHDVPGGVDWRVSALTEEEVGHLKGGVK